MTIRIYRNMPNTAIFTNDIDNPHYHKDELEAVISHVDSNNIDIKNKLKSVAQGSDFFEYCNMNHTEILDEEGTAHGGTQTTSINNLNAFL